MFNPNCLLNYLDETSKQIAEKCSIVLTDSLAMD
jgi:hypothetical protein